MSLTGFALNNSRLTMLITVILMVAGVVLFFNFPSKEDPKVTVREAVVMAAFPGMSTARVEDLITRKLEKEIRRIPEVKKITASSKTGLAVKVFPLVLRASEDERNNLDRVRTINIYSSSRGTNVPLVQVADIVDQTQFSRIDRRNLQRTVTISAKHSWLQADQIQAAVLPAIQAIESEMPAGFSWEWGGETADAEEAQIALGEFIPHCVAAMIILLVWQFNSFAKPLIIFITIPLSFIGAAIGLNLANTYFGFMAILGFLSLAGIIINNAIVLIDQINVELEEGATPYQALVKASVSRFQPVMLTTLTTILGLVPLMMPPDPLFYAMAIVIASGLALGTILTLFAVPVLYSLFFRVDVSKRGVQRAEDEGRADTANAVPA